MWLYIIYAVVGLGALALMLILAVNVVIYLIAHRMRHQRLRDEVVVEEWVRAAHSGTLLKPSGPDIFTIGEVPKGSLSMPRIILQPEVVEWCEQNLRAGYGLVPTAAVDKISPGYYGRVIWFQDETDAFNFKMRWC